MIAANVRSHRNESTADAVIEFKSVVSGLEVNIGNTDDAHYSYSFLVTGLPHELAPVVAFIKAINLCNPNRAEYLSEGFSV